MLKKIFSRFLLGVILFVITLVTFLMNFPLRNVVDSILVKYEKNLAPYKITLRDVQTNFFTIELIGVTIESDQSSSSLIEIDSASVSLIGLQTFIGAIGGDLRLYGGSGTFSYNFFSGAYSGSLKNVNPLRANIVRDFELFSNSPNVSMDVRGNVNSNAYGISVSVPAISLNTLSPSFGLAAGILPSPLSFSAVRGSVNCPDGRNLDINLQMAGDLRGKLEGKVRLNPSRFQTSTLNLTFRGEIDNEIYEANKDLLSLGSAYLDGKNVNLSITNRFNNPEIQKL